MDGKITAQLLKSYSGEFDVSSIHTLKLHDLELDDLGSITECISLERLDLSRNGLSRLTPLSALQTLVHLNLSANCITTLEGLQALENLERLNVAGNLISSIDNLRYIKQLDKLKNVRLRDEVLELTNPVCMNTSYESDIHELLPNLTILDGERLEGKGSDVYKMFRQMDQILKDNPVSTPRAITDTEPWMPENWQDVDKRYDNSLLGDAEEQLQGLLDQCVELNKEFDRRVAELMSSEPPPSCRSKDSEDTRSILDSDNITLDMNPTGNNDAPTTYNNAVTDNHEETFITSDVT